MSNCTVNKCLHSNVPKTVTYPSEPSLDPTCDNTFGSLQSKTGIDQTKLEATRDAVVKECNGGNKCFQGLTCVDGNECDQLYKDLLQKGWGDKDTVGTVLYNVNHASPDNLRDQLKYELCRRASCIPKPLSTTPSAGDMWKDMFKSYRCIFWFAAFFPVLWIMGSIIARPFVETNNVLPTVFAGFGNGAAGTKSANKQIQIALIYLASVIFGVIFYSMVAGKYEWGKFGLILLFFFLSFIPVVHGSIGFFKLVALIIFIVVISSNIDTNNYNLIKNIKGTGITNGIFYLVMSAYALYNTVKTKNYEKWANILMLVACVACGIASIVIGIRGGDATQKDEADTVKKDTKDIAIIAIALLLVSVLVSIVSIRNNFFTILFAFLLFNMIDSSNLLGAVDTYSTNWSNILLSVTLCIVIPLFIKNNNGIFSKDHFVAASTYFSYYAGMSGFQTFIGIFAPPILLSMMTLGRMLEAFFSASRPLAGTGARQTGLFAHGASNVWSFFFCGSLLTNSFDKKIGQMNIQRPITLPGNTTIQNYQFNNAQPVGASNALIFNYRP